MTGIPAVYDALVARWRLLQTGLAASQVLDGPPTSFVGTKGIAVGTTATDTTGQFAYTPSDLSADESEMTSFPNLIWAGSGGGPFRPHRDEVEAILSVIRADIASDRRLGGVVSTCRVVGGVLDQQQTGSGPLVVCEFRIQYRIL